MKGAALLLLVLMLCADVPAQSSQAQSDAPDLLIIKKSWRKEPIFKPSLTADPFRVNDEQAELQRARKTDSASNKVRVKEGTRPEQTTQKSKPMPTQSAGPQDQYVYRVTVKNTGAKTITGVVWNYGQNSFENRIKISTGKSTELVGKSSKLPTFVINATEEQLTEEVVIRRIQYEDGSFWQRPDN